jgi:outer membrane receptor protein involved in Fe transport
MSARFLLAATVALSAFASQAAAADDEPVTTVRQVTVTATRAPTPADQVPADISVVNGSDLRARDAHDMASALALVPGVEAPAGGDAGPSSAVPSFWGLHEFDAFLLVVDGVPWGGAFNPMITTLDMNDVRRIEVLKGSAPVMFGATSFVGVVQELHYPAGQAANQVDLAYGNYGSAKGDASFVLPQVGDYKSSLAVDGESRGFADKRETVSDGKALYRGALDLGDGRFTVDADVTIVRDTPPSPILRDGTHLTPLIPDNANFNPANAEINQNEYHLALGYERSTPWGPWSTLVSVAHSDIRDIRAFLHPDLSGDADTQDQTRHIDDDYADTHITHKFAGDSTFIVGADLLYGLGKQTTLNGNDAYTVPLDGSVLPPPTTAIPVNEIGTVNDKRVFAGQYAQLDWKPDDRWDVTAGLRLNETYEHKVSSDFTTPPPVLLAETASRNIVRLSGTLGSSYRAWRDGADELVVYADYRYAFKPSALDFGPDYTPDVLLPETANSYEAGLKGVADGGRLSYQASVFQLDFQNLVVPTPSGALANAAGERLRGVEVESRWQVAPNLALAANVAWHDAKFTQYLFIDDSGAVVNVAGNQLPLSPHLLASAGILYTPPHGFNGTLVVNYIGRRYLDEENTAPVSGYTTLAGTVGYDFGRYAVTVEGENLTNVRPPVTSSEFGSDSFYLLNARTLWVRLSYKL